MSLRSRSRPPPPDRAERMTPTSATAANSASPPTLGTLGRARRGIAMRNLYVRIFLSFWTAMVLVLTLTVAVTLWLSGQRMQRLQARQDELAREASMVLTSQGVPGLRNWLQREIPLQPAHDRLYVLDQHGVDILGRLVPEFLLAQVGHRPQPQQYRSRRAPLAIWRSEICVCSRSWSPRPTKPMHSRWCIASICSVYSALPRLPSWRCWRRCWPLPAYASCWRAICPIRCVTCAPPRAPLRRATCACGSRASSVAGTTSWPCWPTTSMRWPSGCVI